MNILKKFYRFLLASSSAILLTTVITFGLAIPHSLAATVSLSPLISPLSTYLSVPLASMNRVEAMAKQVEGKTQEAIGNVTGSTEDQIMGRAKQLEGNVRSAAEDVKDSVTSNNRVQAIQKNLEGKAQEQVGNLTGNQKDQFQGQMKQVGSSVLHVVEDLKDTVKNTFN
jgi:uncharacterized protein YjbJ (UPF0337 family)